MEGKGEDDHQQPERNQGPGDRRVEAEDLEPYEQQARSMSCLDISPKIIHLSGIIPTGFCQ